jgi:hypothetical protein
MQYAKEVVEIGGALRSWRPAFNNLLELYHTFKESSHYGGGTHGTGRGRPRPQ